MSPRIAIFAIWACFFLRAGFYASVTPLWEGFDEFSHFSMIQYIAVHGSLPDPRTASSSEQVLRSLQLAPLSREVLRFSPNLTTHDDYWKLAATEREARRIQLHNLPESLATRSADPPIRLYEAQQAPLYYWVMTPIYVAVRGLPFLSQIWILRYATILLSSLVIPIAYLAFRRALMQEPLAIIATATLALIPQLMFMVLRVSNESLAIVAGSLFSLAAFRMMASEPDPRHGFWLGITLGIALLAKAYFLSLLPVAALLLGWSVWKNPQGRASAIRQAAVAGAVCATLAGWWYVRTMMITGSATGEQSIGASMAARISVWEAFRDANWNRILHFLAVSFIWTGNWSFLEVREWMYRAVEAVFVFAAAGVAFQIARPRSGLTAPMRLWFAALPCVFLFAGLCYHGAMSWASFHGLSLGFYLYSLIAPLMVLLATGLARLLPSRWMLAPFPFLAITFLALETFGNWMMLFPYYTGMTSHTVSGGMPTAHLSQYVEMGLGVFFENLAVNKPGFLTPSALMATTGAYLLATLILIAISFRPAPAFPAADPETPAPRDGSASSSGE